MLKEIRCSKLVHGKITFHPGLNTLIGPDDGTNSIGKSSVLMLIDFSLAGDDFTKLSSDVIENVGSISVEIDFSFQSTLYTFTRNTDAPSTVFFHEKSERVEKSIDDYREFLKNHYNFPEGSASFRSTVNPFFRIWGKENYTPSKPLHSFPSEPYKNIKPNLLKLFSCYLPVQELEKQKSISQNKKTILAGAFKEGYIKPLTKRESILCEKRLQDIKIEIDELKKNIELFSINTSKIINERNFQLKRKKDILVDSLYKIKNRQKRIEDNLRYGNPVNKKFFDKLNLYFPDVDSNKLAKIDQFHFGVTKILKDELVSEQSILIEQEEKLNFDIKYLEDEILESVDLFEKPSSLIDRMLELSFEEKNISEQVRFRNVKSSIDDYVSELSSLITDKTAESLRYIEKILNETMSKYINVFYTNNPVSPEIKLFENRYEFSHKEDSGTGKAYANMISMDMSILEITYLPSLIHDLIVFSNIENHAIENIIHVYSKSKKQIFIAIDKLARYNEETIEIIKDNKFLTLDSEHLAFKKSWKNKPR
ncbi:MAG: DUF2326 domain-containing protein [Aeromonas sp.]|uniref:DUF2326 domain-containing protein n=1 Tax=Aeromonas sp. TaxID=647 RepID=UPI002FC85AC3